MCTPTRNGTQPVDAEHGPRFNVPNSLCALRLVGSFALVAIALVDRPRVFLAAFLLLAATDWIDGWLAAWLDQRTAFGARFDSVADAALSAALLFGCIWLKAEIIASEAAWIGAALAGYAVSCAVALVKFRRLPSYHAYSAKIAWFLTVVAATLLLVNSTVWPLRLAMVAVAVANLEALLITLLSTHWQADVPGIWHPKVR